MMRLLILILIGISIAAALWYFSINHKRQNAIAPTGIVWNLKRDILPESEEKGIKNSVKKLEATEIKEPDHSYIEILNAEVATDSAMISGPLMPRSSEYSYTGIFLAIGKKKSDGWHFVTGGDPEFCDYLKTSQFYESTKDYFIGCK